jgi:hypothetical protein
MKYTVQMDSDGMINVHSFTNIDQGIQLIKSNYL